MPESGREAAGFIEPKARMIERDLLTTWSQMPRGADRYLRPFVCRGKLEPNGAAIVGLNPATLIGRADIEFPRYLELLLEVDAFTAFYQELGRKRNEPPSSRTRSGINRIARLLSEMGWTSVLDRNVSPYPTASKDELDEVPEAWQSRWIFRS